MLPGMITIYAISAAWLAHFIPVSQLLTEGVLSFLRGDLTKIAVVGVASSLPPTALSNSS